VVPAGLGKSYSIYAGVQDAFMQWWYGHNAVAFFLTTPFLGLMYYYLPKAADRPVFSYRLSIMHFWSLVFIYIWAGPHHLHYTALPEWASTLGMLFSLMLWMPSWGGMVNGLLTLRGAWHKVRRPGAEVLRGRSPSTACRPSRARCCRSSRSTRSRTTPTGPSPTCTPARSAGTVPDLRHPLLARCRALQTEAVEQKLAETHFWLGTIGHPLYIVAIYVAGITQGLMWRAFDPTAARLPRLHRDGHPDRPDVLGAARRRRSLFFSAAS
jgi:cytochrome c oxidase cbb3-type subunit I/II